MWNSKITLLKISQCLGHFIYLTPILRDELTWTMVEIRYNRILIEKNILSTSGLNGDANQNWVTDD